jgi:NADPH-dependent 2,4-dienoyl-CoA reductase/sulfur reductase-like enzyme
VLNADIIRKAVEVPVTSVGSISDLESAEKILSEGKADIIAMARALVADPEMVNKSQRGRADDVRPCLRCIICAERPARFFPVRCAINPVIGRELEYTWIRPAETKKKIAIIGGGPAGMEAAIIASSRGHEVVLFEKDSQLGGTLRVAASPPFKKDMRKYLDWLIRTATKSSADIRLSTGATPDLVNAEKPDAVIIATGAKPYLPEIPGIDNANVETANDVDTGKAQTGDNVIVVGAGMVGCETALHLVQQGKKVTIVDMIKETQIAEDGGLAPRSTLLELLNLGNVEFKTEVKLEKITDQGIMVTDTNWTRFEISADSIVLALGNETCFETINQYQECAPEVYQIGDCSNPNNLMSAIHDGFNVAVEI